MYRTLVSVFLAFSMAAYGQALPRLEGESLSGKKIVLPEQAAGRAALLVIGFTKASDKNCKEWGKRFTSDFGSNPHYVVYPVAVLESAPRLVRGMITGSMRRGMSKDEQDRFIILVHGEVEWQKFVSYSSPDDAYLLLIDGSGAVRWRGHGVFREADYPALREAAKKLAN